MSINHNSISLRNISISCKMWIRKNWNCSIHKNLLWKSRVAFRVNFHYTFHKQKFYIFFYQWLHHNLMRSRDNSILRKSYFKLLEVLEKNFSIHSIRKNLSASINHNSIQLMNISILERIGKQWSFHSNRHNTWMTGPRWD